MAAVTAADTKAYYVAPLLFLGGLAALRAWELALPSVIVMSLALLMFAYLCVVSFGSPLPLLLVLIVYIPFMKAYPFSFGGLMTGFNLTNILTFLGFLWWVLLKDRRDEPFLLRTPLNASLIALYVVLLISVLMGSHYVSLDRSETIILMKRWLDAFFLYFLFVNLVRTRDQIRNVTVIMMITIAVVAVLGYVEHSERIARYAWGDNLRVQGLSLHSNTSAAFFVYYMFLFPALFLAGRFTIRRAVLFGVPLFMCLRVIMFTGSRGALVAFAAALLFLGVVRARTVVLACLLAGLVFSLNPDLLPHVVQARFGGLFKPEGAAESDDLAATLETSASQRIIIWRGAVDMIANNPLFGVGYGAFPYAIYVYAEEPPKVGDVHNMYLLVAGELGLPALLLFLALISLAFQQGWRLYRTTDDAFLKGLALGLCTGVVSLLVAGMFGSRFNSFELIGYFWVLTALVTRGNLLTHRGPALAPATGAAAEDRHRPLPSPLTPRPREVRG